MSLGSKEEAELITQSGYFDKTWYLNEYSDVQRLGMDPVEHYVWIGHRLGRNPSPTFDTRAFLRDNPDAKEAALTPLGYFIMHRETLAKSSETAEVQTFLNTWDQRREDEIVRQLLKIWNDNPGYFDRVSVSIIMPTYNRASSIGKAIRSVIAQTFGNWELLIIDDGSTDGTNAALAPFLKDHRIKLLEAAHTGVSSARNMGLDNARGDFIFYLDSDNLWERDYLKFMVVFMESCNLSIGYCGLRSVDNEGVTTVFRGDHFDWKSCFEENYIDINCFGHRNFGPAYQRFDENLARLVDWDFILRVTSGKRTAFLPYSGVVYYDGSEGERITLTVAQGDHILALNSYVRAKHPGRLMAQRQRKSLRPRFEFARDFTDENILNDGESRPQLQIESTLIDWAQLRSNSVVSDLVSVIVLGYDNGEMSGDCLKSILSSTTNYKIEVIFVDNGSSDDTCRIVGDLAIGDRRLRYVRSNTNLMFALGNNLGLRFATGEFAVFLNNDTLVQDYWLDPLIDGLRHDPTVGVAGPKLLYPDGTLQCGGLVFSDKSKVPYHIYQGSDGASAYTSKSRSFQALTGACVALRTKEVIRLGGFNPLFINGCEDLDLCFRVRTVLRKRAVYFPRSQVVHLESRSKGRGRHIARNRRIFVRKWEGHVRADDASFYREDGFRAATYVKRGSEPDGKEASYVPELELLPEAVTGKARRTKNVGFCTMWYPRGISFHTQQLAAAVESADIRTHILARWESEKFQNEGAIHHPRVFNGGDDPTVEMTLEWAKSNSINAVVFMEVHPNDWKRVAALKRAGIIVICYENLDIMWFDKLTRYRVFDYFLFNSFHTRSFILSLFPDAKSITVPWGALCGTKALALEAAELVEFVHVGGWGGLNNRKNTDLAIKAFDRSNPSNARLHIYTQVPMSAYGDDVAEICQRNTAIVVHEGTVDDIDVAYQGKSVLLWPSKREGLGLPILEALVRGIPVLASDGYMMKQWFMPGSHGWLCECKPRPGRFVLPEMEVDPEALSRMISHLAANPGQVREVQAAVDRDRWLWEWSWQPGVWSAELRKLLFEPGYTPPEDLSYLDPGYLNFELERRRKYYEV